MADAKCCDRCGRYYRNDLLWTDGVIASVGGVEIFRRDNPTSHAGKFELCDECANAFLNFIHMVRGAEKKEGK